MLILSQDKKHIYNFKNLEEIYISDEVYGVFNWCSTITTLRGDSYVIAYYDTEERSKEVLQEIIKLYKATETFKATSNRISDEVGAIAIQHGFIYEMPEK